MGTFQSFLEWGSSGRVELMVARGRYVWSDISMLRGWSFLGITVWVEVARCDQLGLEGDRCVSAQQELADDYETIIEATYVPQQVPEAVAGAFFDVQLIREVEVELGVSPL